jgi:hypothetical protein
VQLKHQLSLKTLDILGGLRKKSPKFAYAWNLFDSALGQLLGLCNNNVASGEEMNGPGNILGKQAEDGTDI